MSLTPELLKHARRVDSGDCLEIRMVHAHSDYSSVKCEVCGCGFSFGDTITSYQRVPWPDGYYCALCVATLRALTPQEEHHDDA